MTLSRRAASLFTGLLLLAAGSRAQTPLGQPTLDEQKVQIWCAAVRYVYDDNGRGNLKDKLNCGGSLKAFENSIKADSQKVYSLLYQPLEGRGTMYNGLGSNPARLQKLTTEIVSRLKSSPARRADPARMQRLATLETALANYVTSGTPISDVAAEAPAATADLDEATASAPGDAGPEEAGIVPAAAPAQPAGESLVNKFFGPLALILSLLSLVLYALMRRNLDGFQKELSGRIDRRREEIMQLQNTPAAGTPAIAPAAAALTPALRKELEQLVQQRVAEELQKRAPDTPAPAPAAASRPVAAPAAPPAPAAEPVAAASLVPPVQLPSAPREVSAPPPVVPAGSPAAAPQEEFDSLVPPVQLPAAAPADPAPAAPDMPQTRYVKVPVNGAFSQYDFSEEPQHDSIYEIHLDPAWPELATFSVTANPAVHAYAIQSAQYSLREACRYQQPTGPVSRIVTEEEGVLRKQAGHWQIEQKAAIRFE